MKKNVLPTRNTGFYLPTNVPSIFTVRAKDTGNATGSGDSLRYGDCMRWLKMGLFDIAEEQKDGCSIVKITVASGIEKPYFKTRFGMTPRGAYLRVGSSAEPMPQEQIDRLFAMRTRNSIGRIVSNRQEF